MLSLKALVTLMKSMPLHLRSRCIHLFTLFKQLTFHNSIIFGCNSSVVYRYLRRLRQIEVNLFQVCTCGNVSRLVTNRNKMSLFYSWNWISTFICSCTGRETASEGERGGGGGEHQHCQLRHAGGEGPRGRISGGTKDRHLHRRSGDCLVIKEEVSAWEP